MCVSAVCLSTVKAHGHVASREAQVRFYHSQSTRACLVAV
ncbi:hypothetical protein F383_36858 [Gossypium arboreum]|uniref:Uncharacterized protein n=1 Tax=Gossypium arboreum TaxID=29729 RepID=A0A0B0N5W6_GOSAR|nr:hypothetical protein F383_36858 [Gossypium arboreum]